MHYNAYLTIEIWQRGTVSAVGDAHPAISGELGRFRAGSASNTDQQIPVLLNNSSFTVRFATPTCNLSVSPTTIDFGDVGNEKPRVNFTLKNSNCINASSVTLKLTSTKAIYDNSNLSILANTTTGTSAAGGRGVAISGKTHRENTSRRMTAILRLLLILAVSFHRKIFPWQHCSPALQPAITVPVIIIPPVRSRPQGSSAQPISRRVTR